MPIFDGTALIDYNNILAMIPFTTTTFGFAVTQVQIPNIPGFEYVPIYAQSVGVDPSTTSGLVLSNGLEIVLCPQ